MSCASDMRTKIIKGLKKISHIVSLLQPPQRGGPVHAQRPVQLPEEIRILRLIKRSSQSQDPYAESCTAVSRGVCLRVNTIHATSAPAATDNGKSKTVSATRILLSTLSYRRGEGEEEREH